MDSNFQLRSNQISVILVELSSWPWTKITSLTIGLPTTLVILTTMNLEFEEKDTIAGVYLFGELVAFTSADAVKN